MELRVKDDLLADDGATTFLASVFASLPVESVLLRGPDASGRRRLMSLSGL
jgi:hypothetical protein